MENNGVVLTSGEKKYFLKYGFNLIVSLGDVPKVQVITDQGKLIYQGVLNSQAARKKSNRWLSFNTILCDHLSGFSQSNKDADEIIEKKLTELWGNPAFSDAI